MKNGKIRESQSKAQPAHLKKPKRLTNVDVQRKLTKLEMNFKPFTT